MQEQENQKRQLCEELERLKTPQDSREASCQTPLPEEEVRAEGEERREGRAASQGSELEATGHCLDS